MHFSIHIFDCLYNYTLLLMLIHVQHLLFFFTGKAESFSPKFSLCIGCSNMLTIAGNDFTIVDNFLVSGRTVF